MAPDAGGVVPSYEVTITVNGGVTGTDITTESFYTVSAAVGDQVSIAVQAVNPVYTSNQGPVSTASNTIKLLDATADEDADGQSNVDEDEAGTNPFDNSSVFKATEVIQNGADNDIGFSSVAGRYYHLETSLDLGITDAWAIVQGNAIASSSTMSLTHTGGNDGSSRFYRVRVTKSAL